MPPRTESKAITDTRGTLLGRLATASLDGSGPGESGFRLLPDGDYAFDARIALARRAERSLDVQYYQIQRDSVGLQFLRELRDAARRGVRVRLLVDDLYTAGEDELFRDFAEFANVEVRLFNPLPSRGATLLGRLLFSLHEFTRINHRMHNKLFIADNRFSVSGGRNMADEYFMRSAKANFIDMDVIAAGSVVRELSAVFDRYWNSDFAYPVQSVVALQIGRGDGAAPLRRAGAQSGTGVRVDDGRPVRPGQRRVRAGGRADDAHLRQRQRVRRCAGKDRQEGPRRKPRHRHAQHARGLSCRRAARSSSPRPISSPARSAWR